MKETVFVEPEATEAEEGLEEAEEALEEVEEVLEEVEEVPEEDEEVLEEDEEGSEGCEGSGQIVSLGGVYIRSSRKTIDLSNVNTLRGGGSLENVPLASVPSSALKPIGKPLSSTKK